VSEVAACTTHHTTLCVCAQRNVSARAAAATRSIAITAPSSALVSSDTKVMTMVAPVWTPTALANSSTALLSGRPHGMTVETEFGHTPPVLGPNNATLVGFVATPIYREFFRQQRGRGGGGEAAVIATGAPHSSSDPRSHACIHARAAAALMTDVMRYLVQTTLEGGAVLWEDVTDFTGDHAFQSSIAPLPHLPIQGHTRTGPGDFVMGECHVAATPLLGLPDYCQPPPPPPPASPSLVRSAGAHISRTSSGRYWPATGGVTAARGWVDDAARSADGMVASKVFTAGGRTYCFTVATPVNYIAAITGRSWTTLVIGEGDRHRRMGCHPPPLLHHPRPRRLQGSWCPCCWAPPCLRRRTRSWRAPRGKPPPSPPRRGRPRPPLMRCVGWLAGAGGGGGGESSQAAGALLSVPAGARILQGAAPVAAADAAGPRATAARLRSPRPQAYGLMALVAPEPQPVATCPYRQAQWDVTRCRSHARRCDDAPPPPPPPVAAGVARRAARRWRSAGTTCGAPAMSSRRPRTS
jgi:hypothetical protein